MQGPEGLAREADELGGRRQPQGSGDSPHLDVGEARLLKGRFDDTGSPRLNGPGWPGAGAGSCARRRMTDTGIEKKELASGVE